MECVGEEHEEERAGVFFAIDGIGKRPPSASISRLKAGEWLRSSSLQFMCSCYTGIHSLDTLAVYPICFEDAVEPFAFRQHSASTLGWYYIVSSTAYRHSRSGTVSENESRRPALLFASLQSILRASSAFA